MQIINTHLTSLLGTRVPIVSAAMAGAASTALAVEVTRGGGFGFVGAAFDAPEKLAADLKAARASFPDLAPTAPTPIGVGFIGWLLDTDEVRGRALLAAALASNVAAIWLAFGVDVRKWVVAARSGAVSTGAPRPLVFVQVTSVEEARVAAEEWGVDVIVAQGNESGGHGGAAAPPTFTLVSEVLAKLGPSGPPVLAAGGLATGAQIASCLTLGAAGVVLGTRYVLTPESVYPADGKARLLRATGTDTVRTLTLDYARGTYGWPAGIDGRGLRTAIVDDIESGVEHAEVQAKFKAGDEGYTVTWSGTGVGLMDEIKPAKQLTEELHGDVVKALQRTQSFFAV
ncbi:2-nitropropane dioxygenase [Epithele typhae]|uniref:2-nitropropane dioxygenase n=1 Tax=Epithele typhae TaxID=378194 RepID=UPI002007C171|nr:2-nitropropane dioxygenase [Epithele typhae]KAH9940052.1 2-nitropropane dioxygenase [Epithele typhae]